MGLNFQTCTIINSNVDPDSNDAVLFEADGDVLKIKRDFIFKKDNVKAVRSAEGHKPVACKAEVDFEALGLEEKALVRMDVYVKYEGAEPSYGANAVHIQKGIPFWVEFSVAADAATTAANVAKIIKKNHLFLIDKDILNVTAVGGKLVLTGATEYLRFGEIKINVLEAMDSEVVAEMGDAGIELVERGVNGFGTYSQIIKDLRLPTAANYQWTHLRQVETPVIGAIYNQYIIEYCAPASNEGTQFVGHRGESWTTHVFWVKQDVVSDWETALESIKPTAETAEDGE